MGEHERARASADDSRCDDCDEALRRSLAGPIACTCGRIYGDCDNDLRPPRATPDPTPRVRPRPGLDLPVGAVPPPRAPPPRVPRDSPEVMRASRLLAELRPHGPGPRELLDGPTTGGGASLAPRTTARAPWDVDAPRGAFQRDAAGEAAAHVVARIERAALAAPRAGAALAWLRRSGTLAHGLAVLAIGLARALAEGGRLAAWDADQEHGRERSRVWGAARLDEACAAWDAAR